MKNFVLTMSGGTTQVINSTLAGVIDGINIFYPDSELKIPIPGIVGLMNNEIRTIRKNVDSDKISKLPGSSLTGTSRVKILDKPKIDKIEETLLNNNVSTYINIGGSGTIKQSIQLSSEFKSIDFIGLPKTIDNDLGDDSMDKLRYTPGYLSAGRYIISHIFNLLRENVGASYNDKVIVTQMFGRDTSFLAAFASIIQDSRIMILFPENPLSKEEFDKEVRKRLEKNKGCIIVVPEGYPSKLFNSEYDKRTDETDQIMWGSSKSTICLEISNYLNSSGIQTRICNTTIEQRQSNQELADKNYAYQIGYSSIENHYNGKRDFFQSINKQMEMETIPLREIQNIDFNRKFPTDWIDESKTGTTKDYRQYILSLKPKSLFDDTKYIDPKNIFKNYG